MSARFSFSRIEAAVARAAGEGVADAAGRLAETLRAGGQQASVQSAPDGTAQIVLEGAATVAREFGTRTVPARPVIGVAVQANRQDISDAIAQRIAAALKGQAS
jgi:hypothetical protein